MNKEGSEEEKYCLIANLVAELLDGNCTGVYIPGQSSLMPNDSQLYFELKQIAASYPVAM